jgi:putative sigma-54 modulation protein
MNSSIVGRHLELTEPLKEYVESAISQLDKYNMDIISVKTFLFSKEHNKELGVELTINIAQKNTVIIKQKDKHLYTAIDIVIERAKKKLRRMHDKMIDHRNDKLDPIDFEDSISEAEEDEIVAMEVDLHKPLELEDALAKLKSSTDQTFFVFNDLDYKMRILYKRNDGKFGLY